MIPKHRSPSVRKPRRSSRPAARGFASTSGLLDSARFFHLLSRRNRRNAARLDREIEARSTQELSVLMCDSSGFTRKTHQHGILPFLAVMTHCYDRLIPRIERCGGICLSHNADNILAIFAEPAQAVRAALDMHRWLKRRNRGKPDAEQFNVCIGIDHGPVLRLKDNVYGAAVNVAAKVGEDLAGRDEVLVTKAVAERIRGRFACVYDRSSELGGRAVELYRVRY